MSGLAADWIALFLFVVLFAAVLIAEILWLVRKRWATNGTAIAYVLVSNLIGIAIGTGIVIAFILVMLMLTFGPAGTGPKGDVEGPMWIAVVVGIMLPPLILVGLKRIFLRVFKIESGRKAWIYSVVSSLATIVITLVPPPLIYFVIANLSKWTS